MSLCPRPSAEGGALVALAFTAALLGAPAASGAAEPAPTGAAGNGAAGNGPAGKGPVAPTVTTLQLEVWINGQPTDMIASVEATRDGALSATVADLNALGLKAAGERTRRIPLDALAGVQVRYDAEAQRLYVQAADAALIPHRLDVRNPRARAMAPKQLGVLLNYSLAAGLDDSQHGHWALSELSGDFEGRVFGPLGVFSTTAESEVTDAKGNLRRLDSVWSWFDSSSLIAVRAGDLISGGFDWTRPVRLGGVQIRRAFDLRPDLVTMPTPTLSASAAVPSVAEVLVNGATVLSRPIAAGPVVVDNLPGVQGASVDTLVLRDSLGRRTTVSVPFFATADMLKAGLLDFSVETGFARRYYGLRSFDYDGDIVASGSVRYGLNDWLTGQLHTEGGAGLALAGAGGVLRLGGLGAANAALSASDFKGRFGTQIDLGVQMKLGPVALGFRDQNAFGQYADLGAATAPSTLWTLKPENNLPPRQLVQFNSAITLPAWGPWRSQGPAAGPSVGVSYSSLSPAGAARRSIWSGSLRQTLPWGASAYLTAFQGAHGAGRGFFAGLSMTFGGRRTVNVGMESAGAGASGFIEASEQAEQRPGGFGWRMRVEEGKTDDLEAEADYISPVGRADVMVQRLDGAANVQARFDGAIVWMGGRPLLTDRINDAFAVVDTGRAHIPVMFENRAAGFTGADGRLILPYLAANNENAISLDPGELPIDLAVEQSRMVATPIAGGGALVRFVLKAAAPGVLIVLEGADKHALPVGSVGWVGDDETHPFVIGYDGQAYIEGLDSGAILHVQRASGLNCTARLEGAGKDLHASPCI